MESEKGGCLTRSYSWRRWNAGEGGGVTEEERDRERRDDLDTVNVV